LTLRQGEAKILGMVESETGKQENFLNITQNTLRQLRGRARWITQEKGSCGIRTAVAMGIAVVGGAALLTLAALPLFESKLSPVLATPASEKSVVAQTSAPTPAPGLDYIRRGMLDPTPVAGREPLVIEATLSRGKALNGLVFGNWLKLAECPDGSYGWQVRYLHRVQGEGFFNSSGGFATARGTNLKDRSVYNRLYINPNKDLGIHEGPVNLECLAGYIGSSKVTESHSLQYRIELTP